MMSLEEQVRAKLRELDYAEAEFLAYVKYERLEDLPTALLQQWIGSLDTYLRRLALKAEEQAEQFP